MRPSHRVKLHAYGFCQRYQKIHKHSADLQSSVEALYDCLTSLPVASKLEAFTSQEWHRNPSLMRAEDLPSRALSPKRGCTNAYFGLSYQPTETTHSSSSSTRRSSANAQHDPPPPVAERLGVSSCKDTCKACKKSCMTCPCCPLHLDTMDKSCTVLCQAQSTRTPLREQAFFVLGERCYAISGGMSAIFDGRRIPHGVWAPPGDISPWSGVAFATRS